MWGAKWLYFDPKYDPKYQQYAKLIFSGRNRPLKMTRTSVGCPNSRQNDDCACYVTFSARTPPYRRVLNDIASFVYWFGTISECCDRCEESGDIYLIPELHNRAPGMANRWNSWHNCVLKISYPCRLYSFQGRSVRRLASPIQFISKCFWMDIHMWSSWCLHATITDTLINYMLCLRLLMH